MELRILLMYVCMWHRGSRRRNEASTPATYIHTLQSFFPTETESLTRGAFVKAIGAL